MKSWFSRNKIELALFFGVYALILWRFNGIFANEEMPGWDLPGHYYAFRKMALELLPSGHVTGYMHEWSGGISLFQFYAPLLFILMSLAWFATLKAIPIALFFRLVCFLTACLFPIAFRHFCVTFLGRRVAPFAIILSAIFVFTNKFLTPIGLGSGGATFFIGLLPAQFFLSVSLISVSLLESLRRKPESSRHFLLFALSVGMLASGHTVSLIMSSVMFAAVALVGIRDLKFLTRAALAYAVGLLLAAWWLVPFAANLSETSSEVRGVWQIPSLSLFFPLKFPGLNVASLGLACLAIYGLIRAIRDRLWTIPTLIVLLFGTFYSRYLITWLFPTLTMHYERFVVFMYIAILLSAVYGLSQFWHVWAEGTPRRKAYVAFLCVAMVGIYFFVFDYKRDFQLGDPDVRQPIMWSWDEYPSNADAKKAIEFVAGRGDASRVFAQMKPVQAITYVGSYEFFNSEIPQMGLRSADGLYVESSPLTPFLRPLFHQPQEGWSEVIGDVRLLRVMPFRRQPAAIHASRMGMFGVNYVIVHDEGTDEWVRDYLGNQSLAEFGPFSVYNIEGTARTVEPVRSVPAIYLNMDGKLPFRDLAMVLFSGEATYDFPVIDGGRSVAALDSLDDDGYSFVIASASGLDEESMARLARSGKTVFLLASEDGAVGDAGANVIRLPKPEILPLVDRSPLERWPAGWRELQDAVAGIKELGAGERGSGGAIVVKEFGDRRIEFESDGPVILAMGRSPRWRVTAGEGSAFRVTPDFILVSGHGRRVLEYRIGTLEYVSIAVSAVTALAMLGYVIWIAMRRRRAR